MNQFDPPDSPKIPQARPGLLLTVFAALFLLEAFGKHFSFEFPHTTFAFVGGWWLAFYRSHTSWAILVPLSATIGFDLIDAYLESTHHIFVTSNFSVVERIANDNFFRDFLVAAGRGIGAQLLSFSILFFCSRLFGLGLVAKDREFVADPSSIRDVFLTTSGCAAGVSLLAFKPEFENEAVMNCTYMVLVTLGWVTTTWGFYSRKIAVCLGIILLNAFAIGAVISLYSIFNSDAEVGSEWNMSEILFAEAALLAGPFLALLATYLCGYRFKLGTRSVPQALQ